APEHRRGNADSRSDLFSLGVCLIHLLAGEVVDSPREWLYRNFSGNEEFRKALLNVIEDVADNRPISAMAVAERLEGIRYREARMQVEPNTEEGIISGTLQPI